MEARLTDLLKRVRWAAKWGTARDRDNCFWAVAEFAKPDYTGAMFWNHRVIRRDWQNGEVGFGIHEVHYADDGTPNLVSECGIDPYAESVEDLRIVLEQMLRALDKPVLKYEDFQTTLEDL